MYREKDFSIVEYYKVILEANIIYEVGISQGIQYPNIVMELFNTEEIPNILLAIEIMKEYDKR